MTCGFIVKRKRRTSTPGSVPGAAAGSATSRPASGGGGGVGRYAAGSTANGNGATGTAAKKAGCLAGVRVLSQRARGMWRRQPDTPTFTGASDVSTRRPGSAAGSQASKPPTARGAAAAAGPPLRAPLLVRVRDWLRMSWARMPWIRVRHTRVSAAGTDIEDGNGQVAKQVGDGAEKPPAPPGAPTAAKGQSYTWLGRMLTTLGLRSYFVMGQVVEIPYSVRAKWFLIFGLVCCAVFANPFLAAKAGFGWTKPASLCRHGDVKLVELKQRIINMTKVVEGRQQLAKAQTDYGRLNDLTKLYNKWPDGCSAEAAKAAIDAANSRSCSKRVCKWGVDLGINCVDVPYGCPSPTALAQSNAWQAYQASQAGKAGREEPTIDSISEATTNKLNSIITTLLWQVEIASNLYIAYLIVSVLAAPPFYPYKPSWQYRILGTLFRLSKPMWILIVLIVWIGGSYIYQFLNSDTWVLWWHNFAVDPCYNSPTFVTGRISACVDACNDVFTTRKNYTNQIYAINDTLITAKAYYACFSDQTTSDGQWPAKWTAPLSSFAAATSDYSRIFNAVYTMNQKNVTGTFLGRCNMSQLTTETARAPEGKNPPNVVGQLFSMGFIAQIFFKFILAQVLWCSVAYYDPLVMHAGKVEIYYFKQKEATAAEIDAMLDDSPAIPRKTKLKRPPGFIKPPKPEKKRKTWQDRLRSFARDQWTMVLIISWLLFAFTIINMIVSASTGHFKDNTASVNRLKAELSNNITTLYANRTA